MDLQKLINKTLQSDYGLRKKVNSLNEFYESVSKLVLFPEGLDELNKSLEADPSFEGSYVQLSIGESDGFLYGIFIPDLNELVKKMSLEFEDRISNRKESILKIEQAFMGKYFRLVHSLLELKDSDIRSEALRVGAEGLVHFESYAYFSDDSPLYRGMPIKLQR